MKLLSNTRSIKRNLYGAKCDGHSFLVILLQVDVRGFRRLAYFLEWMGKHSLSIFVLVSSNLAVIAIQGFYLRAPENNIVSI